jgi:biotin operon repressor
VIDQLSPDAADALRAYRAWQAGEWSASIERVTRHLRYDGWISAAALGRALGVSTKSAQAAVSYARKRGAAIESDRVQGYRLRDTHLTDHGPDVLGCLPCERLRRATGHVSLAELQRQRLEATP